ncbi:MAG: cation:proton antiporter [Actinobacteria bacterium]|nr:cation:proton antiporter [Actinomycetota bacterium]
MTDPPQVYASADVVAFVIADIAIILLVARAVGWLFVKAKQPRVVGEIVAGILLGPTVLGGTLAKAATPDAPAVDGSGLVNELFPLQAFSVLSNLGQVGLVFFMFLVGLELDQRLLKGRGRQITLLALAVVIVPIGFGFLVGAVLDSATWRPEGVDYTTFSLFLGAGLSVTAFPVMARILQEKGLIATQMGALGVGAAAAVTVLMFLVIAAASASAEGSGVVEQVGFKALLTVAFLAVLAFVVRPLMSFVTRGWREGGSLGEILGILLPLALLAGLAADQIGINALVGGFLFGLAVPARPGLSEAVIERMEEAVVLFLLPIFLAVSGLRTDFRLLELDMVVGLLLFLALMIIGKWGVGYVVGRGVGLASHQAHTMGVLLNCRGLLILVVALIGLQLGVITSEMQLVFVVGAIVTTLMTGPLIDHFLAKEPVPAEADRRTSGVSILDRG